MSPEFRFRNHSILAATSGGYSPARKLPPRCTEVPPPKSTLTACRHAIPSVNLPWMNMVNVLHFWPPLTKVRIEAIRNAPPRVPFPMGSCQRTIKRRGHGHVNRMTIDVSPNSPKMTERTDSVHKPTSRGMQIAASTTRTALAHKDAEDGPVQVEISTSKLTRRRHASAGAWPCAPFRWLRKCQCNSL